MIEPCYRGRGSRPPTQRSLLGTDGLSISVLAGKQDSDTFERGETSLPMRWHDDDPVGGCLQQLTALGQGNRIPGIRAEVGVDEPADLEVRGRPQRMQGVLDR